MADPTVLEQAKITGVEAYYDIFKQIEGTRVHLQSLAILNGKITEVRKNPTAAQYTPDQRLIGTNADLLLGITMAAARNQGTDIEDTLTLRALVEGGFGTFEKLRDKENPFSYMLHRHNMIAKALKGEDKYGNFSLEPNNIAQLTVLQGLNASPDHRARYRALLEKTLSGITDSNGQTLNLDRLTNHDLYRTVGGLMGYKEDGINQPFEMKIGRTRDNFNDWDKLPTVTIPQGQAMAIAALAIGLQAPTEADLQKMEDLPLDNAVNTPNGKSFTLSQALAASATPLK